MQSVLSVFCADGDFKRSKLLNKLGIAYSLYGLAR